MNAGVKIGILIGVVMGAASIMDVIENSEPVNKKVPPKPPKKNGLGEEILNGSYTDHSGQELKWTLHKPKGIHKDA